MDYEGLLNFLHFLFFCFFCFFLSSSLPSLFIRFIASFFSSSLSCLLVCYLLTILLPSFLRSFLSSVLPLSLLSFWSCDLNFFLMLTKVFLDPRKGCFRYLSISQPDPSKLQGSALHTCCGKSKGKAQPQPNH